MEIKNEIPKEEAEKEENVKENKEKMAKEKFERYIELIKQGELFFFKDAYMELIDFEEKEKEKKIKELKDAKKTGEQTPEGRRQRKILESIDGQ